MGDTVYVDPTKNKRREPLSGSRLLVLWSQNRFSGKVLTHGRAEGLDTEGFLAVARTSIFPPSCLKDAQ